MTKITRRREIYEASRRANRVADALRYLDAAVGCAEEAGLERNEMDCSTLRDTLKRYLELDAKTAGFKASKFYSQE